jgi:hypothetical protein
VTAREGADDGQCVVASFDQIDHVLLMKADAPTSRKTGFCCISSGGSLRRSKRMKVSEYREGTVILKETCWVRF